VLRDITERVVIASKGRFDRARSARQRAAEHLPHESTVLTEDFLALTLDVWTIPPESARRVGHPAPFPVELPEQLIRLYTYRDDLVLDPFMGSGSALVAAARLGRRYVGYDLEAAYVDIARRRVGEEAAPSPAGDTLQLRATREGKAAGRLAEEALEAAGFTIRDRSRKIREAGVTVDLVAEDAAGQPWYFDVPGAFTSHRGGLQRTDRVWRALGRASALRGRRGEVPLVLLTTHLPRRGGEGDVALRAAGPDAFFDAISLLDDDDVCRLALYAMGGHRSAPLDGFWSADDLARRAPTVVA
jgi:hypothetical protein